MMISGNRRVPLVYGSSKKTPSYSYNPAMSTAIRVCFRCPPAPQVNNQPIFQAVSATPGDPGSGNLTIQLISYPTVELRVSIYNIYSVNISTFLSAMATATTINIQKIGDPSQFANLTRNSATNNTTYWAYGATIAGGSGTVSPGDYVITSYV